MAVTAAGAGIAPAGASAATVSSQRSQAAAVLHRIEVLDWRRSHMSNLEATVRQNLRNLRISITNINAAIASQQAGLEADEDTLAAMVVGDYKSSTGTDSAAYVLASGSFSDLIQRVDEVSRVSTSSADLLREIRVAQRMLGQQRAQLARRESDRTRQLARLAAARRGLDAAIAGRQAVLQGIDASIASQLAAERQRRAGLAGSTGAAPPPEVGGGGSFTGEASWYGPGFAGHRTADGEIFDPNKLTCASPWLPFNTMLRVTDLATGKTVEVRVNDRGPFGRGVLDLSAHAAQIVGLSGWAEVQVEIL
ncbi:MAG TPA: septal ring lytic transglycosylase RlpA family protein [Gaiellales bacterium]|nr:septal ring lytic transglycosylase RlpA family protein [Gaiellales bacterium]